MYCKNYVAKLIKPTGVSQKKMKLIKEMQNKTSKPPRTKWRLKKQKEEQ
jgi:hypothetical protein